MLDVQQATLPQADDSSQCRRVLCNLHKPDLATLCFGPLILHIIDFSEASHVSSATPFSSMLWPRAESCPHAVWKLSSHKHWPDCL